MTCPLSWRASAVTRCRPHGEGGEGGPGCVLVSSSRLSPGDRRRPGRARGGTGGLAAVPVGAELVARLEVDAEALGEEVASGAGPLDREEDVGVLHVPLDRDRVAVDPRPARVPELEVADRA